MKNSSIREAARERELEARRAPSLSTVAGEMFGRALRALFMSLWRWRLSVLTVVVALIAGASVAPWLGWTVLGLVVALTVAGRWYRPLLPWSPFVRDWNRRSARLALERAHIDGLSFLIQAGIISESDAEDTVIPVSLVREDSRSVLTLASAVPGLSPDALVSRADDFRSLLNAVRSKADRLPRGGVAITFYENDPLDEPVVRDAPAELDPKSMTVACAVNEDGEAENITFGDASGMVVGGVPGSGKTAGTTSFLLPLALSEYVDLRVIDGKGGEDWSSYESKCSTFIRGDEELEPIAVHLESTVKEMYERLNGQSKRLGTSNFWNASPEKRLAADERFIITVIDECQGIFETSGRSKDEKEILGRIYKAVSTLVKRGRSAGFMTILMTQKPTSDSLPTGIRDNCGLRVSFRTTTTAAESAVLGVAPDDALASARAVSIPASRKGGAVLASDSGEFRAVRFIYVPEDVQKRLLGGGEDD